MARENPQERLAASRAQLEEHIDVLKQSVGRELGWTPSLRTWALPLVAFAGGALLAGGALRGRRRKRLPRKAQRRGRRTDRKHSEGSAQD